MDNNWQGGVGLSANGNTAIALEKRLIDIYKRTTLPLSDNYMKLLVAVNGVLENENENIRPKDAAGSSGGILYLSKTIPTIIMPDLHARTDFFVSTMITPVTEGATVLDMLAAGRLQIVCLGDGFHAEGRQAQRWKQAFTEFQGGFRKHGRMDEEMRESLGIMEMVMEMKISFPEHFHFLKGNHENITNEKGGGNFPFRKYAYEGAMVLDYVKKFYGEEFLQLYYTFEKNFPLLAVGRNFLISHAEPNSFYDRESVIAYRDNADVVSGLTWTDNDEAEEGSVSRMLEHYLPAEAQAEGRYFGGHRPVSGVYASRADGLYIQIHNPQKFQIVCLSAVEPIDERRCFAEIENRALQTLPGGHRS
jgi:hypothetical protein